MSPSTWLIRSVAIFKDPTEVERAARDQDADCARIHAAIDAAEKAMAAVEDQQLYPDERRHEWCAIRDQTILGVRHVRHNIIQRAAEAKQTERWMVHKWLSQVNDGRVLREFTADLEQVPTNVLVDYLRYLIRFGDLARMQSVSAVFAARQDNQRYRPTFDNMLGQFTLSQCWPLGERIAKIYRLAVDMDMKITDLFAHCTTKRLCATSQPPSRVEAPSLRAPDVNAALPSKPVMAMQLLPGLPHDHLSRPMNLLVTPIRRIREMQLVN
jgi:hypothetical protein